MHENRTPAAPAATTPNEADRLNGVLAAIVVQAQRLPKGSPARTAMIAAMTPIRDTLDDLTDARQIDGRRALGLADAAVTAGLAQFEREDVIFRPGEAMRAKLAQIGVASGEGVCDLKSLVELNDDEADDLDAFIAGSAARHATPTAPR